MVFNHVGLYWIIKKKIKFYFEDHCTNCILNGPWYNTTICSQLHGSSFEDYDTTARKYSYNLMCYIENYEIMHSTGNDDTCSGGGRPLKNESRIDALVSLWITLNLIYSWLQS